ncbi:MAG: PKD domain-containing protein [Conexibacter sp.]
MPGRARLLTRTLPLALAGALALALVPAAASAAVYCVAPASGCADGSFGTVQAALTQAQANAGSDEVRLGATTYTSASALTYTDGGSTANSVTIAGAGRAATTLTRTTDGGILQITGNARNTVGDLRFHITRSNSFGLIGGSADVFRVDVDADPGAANLEGIQVIPGSAHDVRISMATSGGTQGFVGGGPASTDGLFDSTVAADKGAVMFGGTVRSVRIEAGQIGVQLQNGTIDDASIRLHGSSIFPGIGLKAASDFGLSSGGSLVARHLTIVGDGQASSTGIFVGATADFGSSAQTVALRSSIVRGVAHSFQRSGATLGMTAAPANLTILYSAYDPSTATQSGPGTGPDLTDPRNVSADPRFVDAAGGDLRLRGGSPAIDAGDPAGLSVAEPLTDLLGAPRLVDGNGDGTVQQDMGAFEYQRRAPALTSAAAAVASAKAGTPVTFAASASDADGDDVALAWSFDDGASAAGASVAHAFATPGKHLATVTATDSAGLTATGQVPVLIDGGAIARLGLAPKAFRAARSGPSASAAARRRAARAPATGTTVDFALDAAGSVRFSVERVGGGRKVRGRCVAPRRANRRARRCVRYTPVSGSFVRSGGVGANRFHFSGRIGGRPLSAGRYRLVGSAGGSVRTASFAITPPPSRRAR